MNIGKKSADVFFRGISQHLLYAINTLWINGGGGRGGGVYEMQRFFYNAGDFWPLYRRNEGGFGNPTVD